MAVDKTVQESKTGLAAAYALLGQVLLEAPRRNAQILYDSALWMTFPFVDEAPAVARAAQAVAAACPVDEQALRVLGADYTHLFVGPPKAAAMPWQTMYVNPNATSLSGSPTAEVRRRLRDMGLQRDSENTQLEDHMGNILLVAAVMAERGLDNERRLFIRDHILSWADSFAAAVEANGSTGFYRAVVELARVVASMDSES